MLFQLNPKLKWYLILSFLVHLTFLFIAYIKLESLSFIKWDVIHYLTIKNNGYSFEPCSKVNVAFFPLFPYLMHFLKLNILSTCILNLIFYYLGLIILSKSLKFSPISVLAFCFFPTTFFYYIPYTEALFFLTSALMLYGITKNKNEYLYIGTLLTGLCRPIISILIPAFLILILWKYLENRSNKEYTKYLISIAISILSLFVVAYFQFLQTHTWFAMFKAQQCWDHFFSIKAFFGTSWGSTFIQRWDNIAAAIGFSCLSLIVLKFFSHYFQLLKSSFKDFILNDVEKISFLYIAGISCSIWLFQNDWHSLNRYIWCSPFALILLNAFQSSSKQTIILSSSIFFLWLIPVGGAQHIQVLLQLIAMALFISATFYISNKKYDRKNILQTLLILLILSIALYYQWKFFYLFLNNNWVA